MKCISGKLEVGRRGKGGPVQPWSPGRQHQQHQGVFPSLPGASHAGPHPLLSGVPCLCRLQLYDCIPRGFLVPLEPQLLWHSKHSQGHNLVLVQETRSLCPTWPSKYQAQGNQCFLKVWAVACHAVSFSVWVILAQDPPPSSQILSRGLFLFAPWVQRPELLFGVIHAKLPWLTLFTPSPFKHLCSPVSCIKFPLFEIPDIVYFFLLIGPWMI